VGLSLRLASGLERPGRYLWLRAVMLMECCRVNPKGLREKRPLPGELGRTHLQSHAENKYEGKVVLQISKMYWLPPEWQWRAGTLCT
jgi:hypothetical protein